MNASQNAKQNNKPAAIASDALRSGTDFASYLIQLTRKPLLEWEEERELARRSRDGDQEARNRLVEANMRLVVNVVRNYHTTLIPFEDLVQEGAIGLMTAAERFDPERGFRFSTYATHWIRQSISRALDNKAKAIRVPAHISESLRRLERTRAALIRQTGEDPAPDALAEAMGISLRKVHALLSASQEPVSLDMLVGEEDNTTLVNILNDENAADPQAMVLMEEKSQELDSLFEVLTPREAEVMRKRLGFEEEAAQVLQEIGEAMQISRERVRQIEILALKKMKQAARYKGLRIYLTS